MASRDASGLVDAWRDVPDDDEGKHHAAEQLARVRAIRRRLGLRDAFEDLLAQGEAVPITSLKVAQEFTSRPDHER